MYAVFQTGGKQYRVVEKQTIFVERLAFSIGEKVKFNQVLLIKNGDCLQIGSPFLQDEVIIAEVMAHSLGKKINIVKFRRRKHYRKHQGHRQRCTQIQIISIKNNNSIVE